MEVLLVEDDPHARRFLEVVIAERGHTVTAVGRADAAWDAFEKQHHPLVVLDWMLPDRSGLDLCREIRASVGGSDAVILFVTAMVGPEKLARVLEAGADDYLAKPTSRQVLHIRLAVAERKVTEIQRRRRAEERQRLLEAAVASAAQAVLILTIEEPPRIVFANHALRELTGYTPEAVEGEPLTCFFGAETNPETQAELLEAVQTGHQFEAEWLIYTRDGQPRPVRGTLAPVYDRRGQATHAVLVQQDVSEQRRLERAMVQAAEQEQQRLGHDLHDGLGQQLTGLGFLTRGLARDLDREASPRAERAHEIADLVDSAKALTGRLARGLVSWELQGEGLIRGLYELGRYAEQVFQIRCDVACDPSIRFEDETVARNVYRIAQEALSNAVKHGAATSVTIQMIEEGGQVRLQITDDGHGMPPPIGVDAESTNVQSMGLRIMAHRARMINGAIRWQQRTPSGTRVTCTFPYPTTDVQAAP